MKAEIKKLKNSQLEITVTVDKADVKTTYDQILNKAIQETEVPGFRKGNAPKEKVEQVLGVSKLYGDAINVLLQKYYSQALKENHVAPISNPKVEIKEFDVNKDFIFIAQVAIKPEVKIKDYKSALKKYYVDKTKNAKKENAEKLKIGEKIEHDHAHLHPNEVVDVLIQNSEFEVPDILVEEETNRLMSRLVEQVMAAGMKVDEYLKAQNTDAETLKKNYTKVAENNIRAEIVMNELSVKENIVITDDEVQQQIDLVQDEKQKEQLSTPIQKIYIKTILEKNKLISNLIKDTEGENNHE